MTLPPWLRPWWPLLKRLHRFLTRVCGVGFRAVSPVLGSRGVPRTAAAHSTDTAAREPDVVTWHPGRPGERVERSPTSGDPSRHPVFEQTGHVDLPATYTLEIRGGRLTGDFGAATTPRKVLDHETSTYFGIQDWGEHPVFLRPTLGITEHLPGTTLSLTTRGTAANYYHFLYDAVARLGVLEDSLPEERPDAVIVPHQSRYQRELLDLAGVSGRLLQPRRGYTFSADRLLVPSNPNWALAAPPASVVWLRDRLRPRSVPDSPRRLYLTRGSTPRTRRYVQEPELMSELERWGFARLDPGRLGVQEQIDVFSRAEVIVAPHGAALTNVTFSDPGVRVLEMFASSYVHLGLWAICQTIGARYRYLVAEGTDSPGRPNSGILDDVSIPVPRVLAALDELLS